MFIFSINVDTANGQSPDPNSIGVLFIHHGGMDTLKQQYMWDAAVTMFTYDPYHPVYQLVIWNPTLLAFDDGFPGYGICEKFYDEICLFI